jgi:hypothetical protein
LAAARHSAARRFAKPSTSVEEVTDMVTMGLPGRSSPFLGMAKQPFPGLMELPEVISQLRLPAARCGFTPPQMRSAAARWRGGTSQHSEQHIS